MYRKQSQKNYNYERLMINIHKVTIHKPEEFMILQTKARISNLYYISFGWFRLGSVL